MYRQFSAARAGQIFSDWNGVCWFASSQSSAPIEKTFVCSAKREGVARGLSKSSAVPCMGNDVSSCSSFFGPRCPLWCDDTQVALVQPRIYACCRRAVSNAGIFKSAQGPSDGCSTDPDSFGAGHGRHSQQVACDIVISQAPTLHVPHFLGTGRMAKPGVVLSEDQAWFCMGLTVHNGKHRCLNSLYTDSIDFQRAHTMM